MDERWTPGQWVVLAALGLGVLLLGGRLVWRAQPAPAAVSSLPLGFKPLTLDEEIAAYRRQVGPDRKNPLALDRLADGYMRKARVTGDVAYYLQADQAASHALALAADADAEALLILARIRLAGHDFAGCEKLADRAARLPDGRRFTADLAGLRFDLAFARGDDQAAELALSATPIDGVGQTRRALLAEARGEVPAPAMFEVAARQLVAATPEIRAWNAVAHAGALWRRGQDDRAAARLAAAERDVPGYFPATLGRAELARRAGRWAEVVAVVEPLATRQPRSDLALRLAEAHDFLRDAAAGARWRAAAKRELDQDEATGGFGHRRDRVRLLLGEPGPKASTAAKAAMAAELALRQDPETRLLAIEEAARRGDWTSAEKRLLPPRPAEDARTSYWRGRLAQARGNPGLAARHFARALATDPRFDPVGVPLARAALQR